MYERRLPQDVLDCDQSNDSPIYVSNFIRLAVVINLISFRSNSCEHIKIELLGK